MKPLKIIQMSPPRTASTLLVNILMGFYDYESPVIASDKPIDSKIIKTHNVSHSFWTSHYGKTHNLFFVCSERVAKDWVISDDIRSKRNVYIFDYYDLIQESIVEDIHTALIQGIQKYPELHLAKDRVAAMNKVCKELENKPFSYYDKFYHIHGSHRNRGK